ncbi:MAG: hypothetical protein JOZ54_06910 [Acidobacteria bacterium]|nr:hypothetical protein [Acidobacteriota bacterium]
MSSPLPPYLAVDTVSMNYRYAGAWHEVNARIAQRQNALNIYVSLASGIVGILFASSRVGQAAAMNILGFVWLLPIISVAFAFLNYKHDRTIALLRHFMAECERLNVEDREGLQVIGYNSSAFYMNAADGARRFHDLSSAALVLLFNAIGLVVAYNAHPDTFGHPAWPIVLYFVVAIFAMWLVTRASWQPHTFEAR